MPYADRPTRAAAWLHRRGVTHGDRGVYHCVVDTVVPWLWLARVATRPLTRQRIGRWQWRWEFGP